MHLQLIWLGGAAVRHNHRPNQLQGRQIVSVGRGGRQSHQGFKKSVHDAEKEAVPQSAEPCTTLSESIQRKGASLGKRTLPLHMKDMVGEEHGSNISRLE